MLDEKGSCQSVVDTSAWIKQLIGDVLGRLPAEERAALAVPQSAKR